MWGMLDHAMGWFCRTRGRCTQWGSRPACFACRDILPFRDAIISCSASSRRSIPSIGLGSPVLVRVDHVKRARPRRSSVIFRDRRHLLWMCERSGSRTDHMKRSDAMPWMRSNSRHFGVEYRPGLGGSRNVLLAVLRCSADVRGHWLESAPFTCLWRTKAAKVSSMKSKFMKEKIASYPSRH